jgi:L-ribulose-5-phosphate 3-epimerase
LVDNGRIETRLQEDSLVAYLQSQAIFFSEHKLKVIFESDFPPLDLARFINRLDPALFGINYDVGNSAAMGFNPSEELGAYGSRIVNVHIKDRKLGGTTVPLGTGSADFDSVFDALAKNGYNGNYILQTARASDGNHSGMLSHYRDMTLNWIKKYGA